MKRETLKLIDAYISECEYIFHWRYTDSDKPMKFIKRVKEHSDDMKKIVTAISVLITPGCKKYRSHISDFILSSGKTIRDDTENIEIILKIMSKRGVLRRSEYLFELLSCEEFSLFQKLEFFKNGAQSISTQRYIEYMNYLVSSYHNDLKKIIEVCMVKINSVIVNKLDVIRHVNKNLGKGQIILDPKVMIEIPDDVALFLDLGV